MKRTLLFLVALVAISAALADEQPHALSAINPARLLTQIEAGITLAITYQNGARACHLPAGRAISAGQHLLTHCVGAGTTATRYTSGQQLVLTLSGAALAQLKVTTSSSLQRMKAQLTHCTAAGVTPGSIGAATATTYQYIAAYAPSNTGTHQAALLALSSLVPPAGH